MVPQSALILLSGCHERHPQITGWHVLWGIESRNRNHAQTQGKIKKATSATHEGCQSSVLVVWGSRCSWITQLQANL
eukprot:1158852-Pelagomonas_calceolata.AAC.5